ncbi:hypothetical protein V4C53_14390 [Paraburkholderia azotifigens]|uniref:hypothetical protein n=1 Tax=Paraburkholderia azotifigens TaxID=2057004 RepID=UPI00317FDEC0
MEKSFTDFPRTDCFVFRIDFLTRMYTLLAVHINALKTQNPCLAGLGSRLPGYGVHRIDTDGILGRSVQSWTFCQGR